MPVIATQVDGLEGLLTATLQIARALPEDSFRTAATIVVHIKCNQVSYGTVEPPRRFLIEKSAF